MRGRNGLTCSYCNSGNWQMVGANTKAEKIESTRGDVEVTSIGRMLKKRGLSRHYPHKAQSFDCLQSILTSCGESSLALSKTFTGFSQRPSFARSLSGTAARQRNQAKLDGSTLWHVLEQDLCDSFAHSCMASRCNTTSPNSIHVSPSSCGN